MCRFLEIYKSWNNNQLQSWYITKFKINIFTPVFQIIAIASHIWIWCNKLLLLIIKLKYCDQSWSKKLIVPKFRILNRRVMDSVILSSQPINGLKANWINRFFFTFNNFLAVFDDFSKSVLSKAYTRIEKKN